MIIGPHVSLSLSRARCLLHASLSPSPPPFPSHPPRMCVRARVRWTVLFIHPHESPRRHKGDENADTSTLSLYTTPEPREKERKRGRGRERETERKHGVATPGSDPSQLLPIIRVLGFTPTGSTTCSTDSAYAFVLDRKRSQASVSSRYPPFFHRSDTDRGLSNVSATGSKRR